MPELPEVETVRAGLTARVVGARVRQVRVHQPHLRWPVPADLPGRLAGQPVLGLERRGKYLLFRLPQQTLLVHLGMSGSLRICAAQQPLRKHDHVELLLDGGDSLRFHDPRRFGAILLADGNASGHPLLVTLGPEPLGENFDGAYLHRVARNRKLAVKSFLMDAHVVVGVGNIYASEALFRAGIRPGRAAGRVSRPRYDRLAEAVRAVLAEAIRRGGTTLRDFVDGSGNPGYFARELSVYGRAGAPCPACGEPLRCTRIGQRSSFWCRHCQK